MSGIAAPLVVFLYLGMAQEESNTSGRFNIPTGWATGAI